MVCCRCSAKVAVDENADSSRQMTIAGPLDQVEAAINLVRQVFSKESYDNAKHADLCVGWFGLVGWF